MKTPREILFERHRRVEPKLDVIRQQALAELATATDLGADRARGRELPFLGAIFRTLWLQLICPCRRAWAGMAVLWLAVAAANFAMKAPHSSEPVARSGSPPHLAQTLDEQRRLLAELLPPVAIAPKEKRTKPSRRPRSERPVPFKAC